MNNIVYRDILSLYKQHLPKSSAKQIEEDIEKVIRESQSLYWSLLNTKEKMDINPDYTNVLSVASEYLRLSSITLEDTVVLKSVTYGQTESHIHALGGGGLFMRENEVAKAFFKNRFVERIYLTKDGTTDFFLLVVSDDDDISIDLADIKIDVSRANPDYYFEINYVTTEEYYDGIVPTETKCFNRG